MNTVLASLLVMSILPVACSFIAGYFRRQQFGNIDNKHPRDQCRELTGAGARAVAAQSNTWEALAILSAALLAVFISGLPVDSMASLCLAFVALRVVYIGFYLANIDVLRSLSFIAAYGVCMYMFYLALSAP